MRNVQIFKYLHCFMDRVALWRKVVMLYGQEIECPSQKIEHCQNSIALWTGLLFGQKRGCFMDNKSNVQTRKCDIAKIRLLYGRVALWTKSGDAFWMDISLNQ